MTLPERQAELPLDTSHVEERRKGSFARLLRTPLGLGALLLLAAVVVLGLLEPVLSVHDPNFSSLKAVNTPPFSPDYILGADQYGRDIWSRSLVAINVSVISGLIGAGVAVSIGTVFGLISGYLAKRTDAVLSWLFNLVMTFPALILVMILYPITGGDYKIMMAVFGIFISAGIYRLVRNLVLGVRNELYVDAARVAGLSNFRILSRHVLYAVRGPIIIASAFLAVASIGIQAGLAFLGLGSSQLPSFGSMAGAAFLNIYQHPIQMLWPSLFLALITGTLVMLANAYRDSLAAPNAVPKKPRRHTAMPLEGDFNATDGGPRNAGGQYEAVGKGNLLTVRNLRVQYPQADGTYKSVVKGVSLDVSLGEVVGVVGESGSGKTQTAFSILGLLPRQARVSTDVLEVAGESIAVQDDRSLRRMRGSVLAYIPQEPMSNLDPSFTVGSQLVEPLTAGMSKKEARATILALLARVGIPDPVRTFNSYPHQISGGMAQRVLIAGAVASRPKLLIADEPTTALDVTVQAEILDLLRDLQAEFGMGVLLVTHNFGVVADLCDRVVVMKDGEMVESGDVRSIFHAPSNEYTQQLIAAILDENTTRSDPPASASLDLTKENAR
ncbi:dipeptide/oligopeptide/nickel ABC transporter permease/ATP-binding protein [Arthrobacter sp. OY3WO11]|uniref:dipeptide/oligopeptide/nickel ABC transporter permease/ATP-binding protein n=1 Tax=Arthrobacter sp. OY3WO11 TaxID=1835723 RepID=UPI0007D01743|nr:dipeptide/oligopeptide/nickel ABC transporter permease/ATP-binding protein [Arthrobacter sp. OY3WO11]OAD97618.1 ABC transporter [Arthrobacter sp. OY3WO11]